MSTTKPYTVGTTFRHRTEWKRPGETVHLTDDERDAYAAHLVQPDAEDAQVADAPANLPGQEPQAPTPIDPITEAQAEAGDLLAQDQIARAESGHTEPEGRGDIADEATETSAYETKEDAAQSTRPMTAAKPKPSK